ncbi:HNH endonuclease [Rhodococcus pyridinivorans]|uniref:HNH endonuclease n=1 Tax=Rhodococcus pyridinivorans TaxID=103816 RepID=UPI003416CFFF
MTHAQLKKALTRQNVDQAIDECDRLGRERFLAENGFDTAHEYFLIHNGRAYDSKAITGVAYRFATGERIVAANFSGGKPIAAILTDLGFRVTGDADWTWPELVLACDLLYARGWSTTIRADDPAVQELSQYLRSLDPDLALSPGYRSPGSVQLKLENIRTAHPDYRGTPTRGARLDRLVLEAFLADPAGMHELAERLRTDTSLAQSFNPTAEEQYPSVDELGTLDSGGVASALEGAVKRRWAAARERDPKLRKQKIARSKQQRGEVSCEVCGFDFARAYPGHGNDYIEVHHRIPLHASGEVTSTLDDLILLCANCHRMIHRTKTWVTPEELRQIVARGQGVTTTC